MPQLFAVGICRKNLPWLFTVNICRSYLRWEFAAANCRGNLSWPFAVRICRGHLPCIFVYVRKSFFVYVSKSCLYGSKPFLDVSESFLFVRFSLLMMFHFVITVAVMGHRSFHYSTITTNNEFLPSFTLKFNLIQSYWPTFKVTYMFVLSLCVKKGLCCWFTKFILSSCEVAKGLCCWFTKFILSFCEVAKFPKSLNVIYRLL